MRPRASVIETVVPVCSVDVFGGLTHELACTCPMELGARALAEARRRVCFGSGASVLRDGSITARSEASLEHTARSTHHAWSVAAGSV